MNNSGISRAEIIRNELDITYRSPLIFQLLASLGIGYHRIPPTLRNLVGRVSRRRKLARHFPVDVRGMDPNVTSPWQGTYALCLTHDIDTRYGMETGIELLADVERHFDVRSTWCVVPKSRQYKINIEKIRSIIASRNEVAAHGLTHDGRLALVSPLERERRIVMSSASLEAQIGFKPKGFRAPMLQRTKDMMSMIQKAGFAWDSSFPDTDPTSIGYEGSGCATVFPFRPILRTQGAFVHSTLIELPITICQDWTLIHSLGLSDQQMISAWKKKIDFVSHLGGMALLLTHPDEYDMGTMAKKSCYTEIVRYALSKGPIVGTCGELAEMWGDFNPS